MHKLRSQHLQIRISRAEERGSVTPRSRTVPVILAPYATELRFGNLPGFTDDAVQEKPPRTAPSTLETFPGPGVWPALNFRLQYAPLPVHIPKCPYTASKCALPHSAPFACGQSPHCSLVPQMDPGSHECRCPTVPIHPSPPSTGSFCFGTVSLRCLAWL